MAVPSDSPPNVAGERLVRDIWAITSIALLATILRVVAKIRILQFKWDDILMVAAQIFGIAGSIIVTIGVQHGLGQHVWYLPPARVPKVIIFDYVTQALGLSASCLGRVAFTIYLLQLLGSSRTQRVMLWILITTQVVTNVVSILIMFLQCPGHGSAIWDRPNQTKCWGVHVQAYFGFFQGSVNSVTDLYLAAFPTYIFWNLKMKLKAKLGLMALLGLGIFAMAASIVKTVEVRVLANPDDDPTATTITMDRWLYIETYLVITTASIPCIRSLVRRKGGQSQSDLSNSYELSSRRADKSGLPLNTKRPISAFAGKYGNQLSDDTGSEDNILRNSTIENAYSPDSGILERIDITTHIEPR
ncbi:hypothetical protein VF21_04112 [Pseudogymnoascus sp. 05NY08]|nr:hypothetical protein VF21_04112 [Pseudogymnoascus sp. 05NY08]